MSEHERRPAGRPREFQPEIAARAALGTFWARSFDDVSVSDLEESTGVVRTSLYNTFTHKRGLFDAALEIYLEDIFALIRSMLVDADKGLDDVHAFFYELERVHLAGARGCFMINSMIEFAAGDSEMTKEATEYLDRLRAGFHAALARASASGEFGKSLSVEATADQLVLQTVGLNVAARSGVGADRLRRLYRSVHDAVRVLRSR